MTRFAALAVLASTGILRADPVTITNPGFESPVTGNGAFTVNNSTGPTGWTVYNPGQTNTSRSFGVLNPTGTTLYPGGAPEGANVGVVFLMNTTNIAEAGLQQTLASTLQANTRYTLRVAVGNIANDASAPHNQFNFTGFPGYRIDLLAGGTVIASDNNTLLPAEGTFLTSTVTYDTGATVTSGQALGIRLVNLNGPNGIEVNFDNVRLDATPVPEPAGLLAVAVGFAAVRRRLMPQARRVSEGTTRPVVRAELRAFVGWDAAGRFARLGPTSCVAGCVGPRPTRSGSAFVPTYKTPSVAVNPR